MGSEKMREKMAGAGEEKGEGTPRTPDARPPFSDFCVRRRTQNSDWFILTVGRMGIELVKRNLLF